MQLFPLSLLRSSKYLTSESHNFKNFVFSDVTLRYSIKLQSRGIPQLHKAGHLIWCEKKIGKLRGNFRQYYAEESGDYAKRRQIMQKFPNFLSCSLCFSTYKIYVNILPRVLVLYDTFGLQLLLYLWVSVSRCSEA